MATDCYISDNEPKETTYCAGCGRVLHAPFLVYSPARAYDEPPCDEWYCDICSKDDEEWQEYHASNTVLQADKSQSPAIEADLGENVIPF